MKKYIGTKEVSATPAWRVDGVIYPKDGAVPRVMNREDGYKVVYEDGYESWSPKEVFEKAYKPAETQTDRMKIERDYVRGKLDKLCDYVDSSEFAKLKDDIETFCLLLQVDVMDRYVSILGEHIRNEGVEPMNIPYMDFGIAIKALRFGFAVRRKGWNGKGLFVVKQVPAHITEDIIPKMQSLPQSAKDIIMARKNKYIDYTSQMLIINPDGRADSWVPSASDVFAEDWEIVVSK